jgi:hypothetical protein
MENKENNYFLWYLCMIRRSMYKVLLPGIMVPDADGFCSFSLESSLQRAERHSVNPPELASWQATGSKFTRKPLDRHLPTSANSAPK